MLVCVGGGDGVWMGGGRPCPPVRNDIVTQRHLFQLFCNIGFAIFIKDKKGVCYEKESGLLLDHLNQET